MSWKMVKISSTSASAGERLFNQFSDAFKIHGSPPYAAMFGNRDPAEDYTYYFSPKAGEIFSSVISTYDSSDCAIPDKESVRVLLGHSDADKLLNS